MFDLAVANGVYLPCLCFDNRFPTPEQWTYIIIVVSLICVVHKFFISKKIPRCNKNKLLDYYENLIYENLPLLVSYIRSYHLNELHNFVEVLNSEKKCESDSLLYVENCTQSASAELKYPASLFHRIIFNKSFVERCIELHYSEFYLKLVSEIKNSDVDGLGDSVRYYYTILIEQRNPFAVDALVHTNNVLYDREYDNITYRLDEYNFSKLTFGDPQFIIKAEIWRVFGESGYKDASINSIYSKQTSEWLEDSYTQSPARLCVAFYDIFIRKYLYDYLKNNAILETTPSVYIYYLFFNCKEAISRLNEISDTYAERLYKDTCDVIYALLEIQLKYNCLIFMRSLSDVLESFFSITNLNKEWKKSHAKWLIESYFNLTNHDFEVNGIKDFEKCFYGIVSNSPSSFIEAISILDTARYAGYQNYEDTLRKIKSSVNEHAENTYNS
jgi:hypothetical protein